MRRLIEWIYRVFFGLRIKSQEAMITDLQLSLSGLLDERDAIQIQINHLSKQLLEAHARHKRLIDAQSTTLIDRGLPDPAPRSY